MNLKEFEERHTNPPTKSIIESNLHHAFEVHGPVVSVTGPDVPRHIKSLSYVTENGKWPTTIVENDKPVYDNLYRKCNARKNVKALFEDAKNLDYSDIIYADLDLMKAIDTCLPTFLIALSRQSLDSTNWKAFVATFSLWGPSKMPQTIEKLNLLFSIVDAKIVGFDNIKDGWESTVVLKSNTHTPNFKVKGRIRKLLAFSYKGKGKSMPMFTLGFEYK